MPNTLAVGNPSLTLVLLKLALHTGGLQPQIAIEYSFYYSAVGFIIGEHRDHTSTCLAVCMKRPCAQRSFKRRDATGHWSQLAPVFIVVVCGLKEQSFFFYAITINIQGRPPQKWNYLLEGGPLVVQASLARR